MPDTLGWMRRRFAQVDVFTDVPYAGNPVAVVLDGDGISDDDMQRVARWTNLSETTFVLPPTTTGADYRVRIFTPALELPFAGHPTLGTCHAWLAAGGTPQRRGEIVQECTAGLVRVRRTDAGLAFAGPPLLRSGPADAETVERIAAAFGLERSAIDAAEWVDNGPGFDRPAAHRRRRRARRRADVRRRRRRPRRVPPAGLADAPSRCAASSPTAACWSRTR